MENQNYDSEYYEIDLMDYVKVLFKRKWFIIGITLISVIIAVAYNFFTPKAYEISTSLEIGRVGEQITESLEQLKSKMEGDVYGLLVRNKLGIPESEFPEIKSENPKGTNLLSAKIESSETEKSKNILEKVNDLILQEHQQEIEEKKEIIQKDIKTMEDKIKITEEDIISIRNKINPINDNITRIQNKIASVEEEQENLEAKVESLEETLVYEQTPGTQYALHDAREKLESKKQEIEDLYTRINSSQMQIENLNIQINSLERDIEDYNLEINDLETKIEDHNSEVNSFMASLNNVKLTKVIKDVSVSEKPVAPRPLLNVAIAGVLGGFTGIFGAFLIEWWEENKDKLESN